MFYLSLQRVRALSDCLILLGISYHYRRGSLEPTTIRDLVMYMCATKFDLGEEELETFRQSFTREERERRRREGCPASTREP